MREFIKRCAIVNEFYLKMTKIHGSPDGDEVSSKIERPIGMEFKVYFLNKVYITETAIL